MQIKKFLHDSIESLALAKHLLTHIKFCPTIPSLRDGKNDELFIIANGPSLQNDIGGYEDLIASKDVLMMNNAIQTPLFAKLQPKYYVLMDSMYFVGIFIFSCILLLYRYRLGVSWWRNIFCWS